MRIAEVLRLRITGWTYQCLYMPTRVEHELRVAAEKPRRSMTRAPSDDMVRLTAHDVHVPGKVAQLDRRSEHLGPAARPHRRMPRLLWGVSTLLRCRVSGLDHGSWWTYVRMPPSPTD